MKLRSRQTKLVAALAAMALLATACGSGADPGDDPANDLETSTAEPDASDEGEEPDSTDSGELDTDATLVFQANLWQETIDPDATTSGYDLALLFNTYDRLLHVDQAAGELIPGLAESWEYLEDGTVLRLNLRQGVVFHDGEPFNAEAVAANFDRTRDHQEGRQESTDALAAVASYEVVDEYTIDLFKNEEDELGWSIIEPNMAVGMGVMISPKAIADEVDLSREAVGSGPFRFVEYGADRIVYERFEDYWDPEAAKVARLEVVRPSSAEAHLSGVISGEIDLTQLEVEQRGQAESADLNVAVQPTLRVWHMYMNHSLPPLDDMAIRQAFLYAIDRSAVVEAIADGAGVPTPQYFPPSYYAFHPDHGEEAYPFDPDRAREMVEASEYWEEGGVDIEMEIVNQPESRVRMAELVQDYLLQVGINANFTPVENSAATEFRGGTKHIDLGPRSRLDPLQHLASSLDEDGDTNPGGFTTEEMQSLLDTAAAMPANERGEVVREISALQTEEAWNGITLYAESEVWADRCIVGFEPPLATFFSLHNVGIRAGCQ